jgi:hypothetical protein
MHICTRMIIPRSVLLRMGNILKQKVLQKFKTHFVPCNFFSPEHRAFYGIMWKNIVETERPQMTIWRTRIARWVTKTTDTPQKT